MTEYVRPRIISAAVVEFTGIPDTSRFCLKEVADVIANEGSFPTTATNRSRGRAHLIGIAGAGMRAMADVLLARGWQLSGSDKTLDTVGHLADRGVPLHCEHRADNLPADCTMVVHSDAIEPDNSELIAAARRGIPRYTYFELLGRLMSTGIGLAVAGTHGKSTTTAMAAQMLTQAGLDPTVFCGAAMLGQPSGGRAGRSGLMLAEACEYRRNFLNLRPRQAVILGIEPDHFDCYDGLLDVEEAFAQFARRVLPDGLILASADCPATRRVVADVKCRVETFALDCQADWVARNLSPRLGRYRFEICRLGHPICDVSLPVPGRHNVLNALAAAALAWHNGVLGERIRQSLARVSGLQRRFELLQTEQGPLMIDDYAHHPTEVIATLRTVRQTAPHRRIWCVFQPHQASRTERLLDELAAALHNADKVLVAEIFRAREGPLRSGGVTAADLARRIRLGGGDAADVHSDEGIVRHLQNHVRAGDVVVTMGAGDIRKIAQRLRGHRPSSRMEDKKAA